jgi:ADP-ribose pyrophosphatase YjhB (NUDIX family)
MNRIKNTSNSNNTQESIPILLRIIAIWFAVFALGVTVFLVFFSENKQTPPDQAIYWFVVSLVAAVIPWVNAFKWGEMELIFQKLESIDKEVKRLSGIRYANLVYMIDKVGNLAVILHPKHKVWIPCGTRLDPYEMPHNAVYRAVSEELGLNDSDYQIWPKNQEKTYDETQIVPRPYQVQVENIEQRQGEKGEKIDAHYDFVYVCTTDQIKPPLKPELNGRWISLQEFRREIDSSKNRKITFLNVEMTYEKILKDMGRLNS